jgi:Lysyl oxidase
MSVPRKAIAPGTRHAALAALAAASAGLMLPAALFAQGGATGPSGPGGTSTTSTASGPAPGGGTETSATTTSTTTSTTSTTQAPLDPCARPALHLRCPDLVMSAPSELHLDRSTIPGRLLLRATSSVNSVGSGPIELRAHRSRGGRWTVYQAIYDRRGHARMYRTAARLTWKYVPGDRYGYGYVEPASYWKVRHVAAFELWSLDANMQPVALARTGPKVDYCLRDLERTRPSRRSPRGPVYPACSQVAGITRDVFGTSVGWSDIYPYGYPEQWIDVTGLHGPFAFVQIANPDGLWHEASVANNASETFVSLPSGHILGQRTGVPAP